MRIKINGENREIEAVSTVSALLDALAVPSRRGIAVAINDRVVPRSQWDAHPLHDGDAVEIIRATQGG